MLIGAGPSSSNTPEENARLIKGLALRAELERDYADFLEQYVQDKGDAVGADKLWNAYKQAEVFVGGTYNPDRTNWQDYFAGTTQSRTSTETVPKTITTPSPYTREELLAELARRKQSTSK